MLAYQSNKSRFFAWLFDEVENVQAYLSVLEHEQGCHCEDHHAKRRCVVKQHRSDLYKKKAIADQHLHVVHGTERHVLAHHVHHLEEVAECEVISVKLGTSEVEPG